MSGVRTRFAPSPTGILHMGSARTALFNWAFARRHGGQHALRIEDTDRERSTEASERALLAGLEWLGIEFDAGPIRQSEGRERHDAAVARLLETDRAYRCVCTREELEARREQTVAAGESWVYDGRCRDRNYEADCGPHTVRLRLDPETYLGWEDLVFGPSGQAASEIGDMNIRRSDGHPLYNLAVVVDDLHMEISHVIRGADHLANTCFQIALYRALDAEPPRFAHVPLIVGAGGKKLSKRRDPVSVLQFRDDGYLPDAMLNWLVRIGWSHGDQEIFSREEICTLFDLESVSRSPAQADPGKLEWLSQHYLKELPRHQLMALLLPFLSEEAGRPVEVAPELEDFVDLLRERSTTLAEMARRTRFLLVDTVDYEEKAARKFLRPAAQPILDSLHERLSGLAPWEPAAIETIFETVRSEQGDIGMGKLAQPVRVAVTGSSASPGIYETLAALGKDRTIFRIAAASEWIATRQD
ncbi:MAG: glutamate--tRNA ligase [Myxococcota bacterium]|nr:glutamate--tRNA ligase [Myxococcota bacterium]